MDSEEKESSEESDYSDDVDTLEVVKNLVTKDSKEIQDAESKKEEEKEKTPEDSAVEDDSLQSKNGDEEEEISQKEELLSAKEEELKKEEKRRENMKALLSRFLDFKTKKELEKAMLNEKKIVAQWLYPFRDTYQKEWELEMKKLKLGFQKTLDFKKSHIQAIQQEKKSIELNHLWADSAHHKILEELFEFLHLRCEKLKEKYLEELEETKEFYLEREKEIIEKCSKAEEKANALASMRQSVRDKILRRTREIMAQFENESEFLKEKELELIKQKHLSHVEKIAHELQTTISPPEHKMEEVRALFLEWKQKYESFSQLSEKHNKKLASNSKEIPELEAKVTAAKEKLDLIRTENKMAKQKKIEELAGLQKTAKKYEGVDPSLRKFISSTETVMKELKEYKLKLEKIIRLKNMCDKLETDNDKRFSEVTFLEPSEMEQLKENDCLPLIRSLCSNDVVDQNLFQNLRHKMNRVKLQNQFLQHSIQNLQMEEKALKSDMKKFLHLISRGECVKSSEDEIVTLYQSSGKFEKSTSEFDKSEDLDKSLQLLNKKYQSMNKKIINEVEKM